MDKKTLGLTVYKYPENKFPHEEEILISYETDYGTMTNDTKYQIAFAEYPSIRQPKKFNKDYFILKKYLYSSEKVDVNFDDYKNFSWCKMSDLTDGMVSMFK